MVKSLKHIESQINALGEIQLEVRQQMWTHTVATPGPHDRGGGGGSGSGGGGGCASGSGSGSSGGCGSGGGSAAAAAAAAERKMHSLEQTVSMLAHVTEMVVHRGTPFRLFGVQVSGGMLKGMLTIFSAGVITVITRLAM